MTSLHESQKHEARNQGEPLSFSLQSMDSAPIEKVREYLLQREEKEFYLRATEVKSVDDSVVIDIRQQDEHPTRKITIFVDPNWVETVPAHSRKEALQHLYSTGVRIFASQGVAVHSSIVVFVTDSQTTSVDPDSKRWRLEFQINLDETVPEEQRKAALLAQQEVYQWLELNPEQRAKKISQKLEELNDEQLCETVAMNAPYHHTSFVADAVYQKAICDGSAGKIAELERFLRARIGNQSQV